MSRSLSCTSANRAFVHPQRAAALMLSTGSTSNGPSPPRTAILCTCDPQPEMGGALPENPSAVCSPRVIHLPVMSDLVTARLVLHPMTFSEAERVVAGESGTGARWAPGYPADGEVLAAKRLLRTCAETGDPRPFGNYEIRRREDGQAIGGVGFHAPADKNGSVTIGFGLIPSARGKGYASEALRGLLLFARAHGVTCVKGDADHDNTASQHVMTAAGMQPTGQDERFRYFEIAWTNTTANTDSS
jgi:RimJ/RimL family protein N-acetyltransferase